MRKQRDKQIRVAQKPPERDEAITATCRLRGRRNRAALISQKPFLLIRLRFNRLEGGGFKMKKIA